METKYQKGKIYMIKSLVNEDIYIGSTILSLKIRLNRHRNDRGKRLCESHKIIKDKHEIILIEDHPCNSFLELRKREQYWIDKFNCINKQRAYRTDNELKDYHKNYICPNYNNKRKAWREFKSSWGYNNYLGTTLSLLYIDKSLFD